MDAFYKGMAQGMNVHVFAVTTFTGNQLKDFLFALSLRSPLEGQPLAVKNHSI